ncbi:hypothetical protein HDU98_012085, partial [Podochytrium sp. JEL0797]
PTGAAEARTNWITDVCGPQNSRIPPNPTLDIDIFDANELDPTLRESTLSKPPPLALEDPELLTEFPRVNAFFSTNTESAAAAWAMGAKYDMATDDIEYVYTDGSLITGTHGLDFSSVDFPFSCFSFFVGSGGCQSERGIWAACEMGAGAVASSEGRGFGRVWGMRPVGWPSSTLPETVALTGALLGRGNGLMVVRLDNLAAVKNYGWLLSHLWRPPVRHLLKRSNAMQLAVQAAVCERTPGPPAKVEWVKGHDGNVWNEKADLIANSGRKEPVMEQYWDRQEVQWSWRSRWDRCYGACPTCFSKTTEPHGPQDHCKNFIIRSAASNMWAADRTGLIKIPPGTTSIEKRYIASYHQDPHPIIITLPLISLHQDPILPHQYLITPPKHPIHLLYLLGTTTHLIPKSNTKNLMTQSTNSTPSTS